MSTVVTDEGHTTTIALGSPPAARLFGLPFLLIGVYLALHWVAGVGDIVLGRAAFSEMIVGTVLLLFLALAFAVPGWILTLGRSLVTIDRAAQTVTTVRDLRIYRHRATRPLSEFDRVEVAHLSVGTNRASASRTPQFQVELAGPRGAHVLVGLFAEASDAAEFGRQVGHRLGLPLVNYRQ